MFAFRCAFYTFWCCVWGLSIAPCWKCPPQHAILTLFLWLLFDCIDNVLLFDGIDNVLHFDCTDNALLFDCIDNVLLSDCIDSVFPTLTNVTNLSLSTGAVPKSLKKDVVKPLLKKASLDPNISNTSDLCQTCPKIKKCRKMFCCLNCFPTMNRTVSGMFSSQPTDLTTAQRWHCFAFSMACWLLVILIWFLS